MKLTNSLLALSSLVALAAAQDSTTTAMSAQASCASKCGTQDVCCIAVCYNVPCPSSSMANATNECVADCPKDEGNKAYISCQSDCFASHFFPATMTDNLPTDLPTSVSATDTGSGSEATKTGSGSAEETGSDSGSGSGSGSDSSGTATGSGAAATSSDNAGALPVNMGASAAGFLGLVVAALVL